MFIHEHQKRIRYGETDQMGYLYYGNYALLFEIGRVEAIREMGTTYKYMEEEMGVMMPVIFMECRYLAPAKYDELITIRTILKELPTKIIEFHHEILNESGKLIHRGVVKLFFIDMKTNKRVSTPSFLTNKIKHLF
ncbi:MAG: acyl-CoA thioester hydrolase [Saprospiraceae bacterium]|jgi:acyl-CoA thioester hydrolase